MFLSPEFNARRDSAPHVFGCYSGILCTASRTAARSRLRCPHECTHELAVHLRCDCIDIDIDALACQERARILNVVDARRLDLDLPESGRLEFVDVLRISEGAGDAADSKFDILPHFGRDVSTNDHIGDSESAPWFEYTEGFA